MLKIVNTNDLPEEDWTSPNGRYAASGKDVSIALGREGKSTDLLKRHPFDLEISRIPPGKTNTPFHAHSAQWEFYHVLSGTGQVRHADGLSPIRAGDAMVFKPGEAHQFINDSEADLVLYVIADNPISESVYYPDEERWLVLSPTMARVRFESNSIFDPGPAA